MIMLDNCLNSFQTAAQGELKGSHSLPEWRKWSRLYRKLRQLEFPRQSATEERAAQREKLRDVPRVPSEYAPYWSVLACGKTTPGEAESHLKGLDKQSEELT